MMILVTGGSKCGKSSYAESLFEDYPHTKYYIATMQPFGAEAFAAIERHQKLRADKGFLTIEQYTDADRVTLRKPGAVLLECMGNLLANEMFRDNGITDCADKIINNILRLNQRTEMLVIVTNQVGSDGIRYEAGTSFYMKSLGQINAGLAEYADRVVECVYGIPVRIKG